MEGEFIKTYLAHHRYFRAHLTPELLAEIRQAAECDSGVEVVVGYDLVNEPIIVCLAMPKTKAGELGVN